MQVTAKFGKFGSGKMAKGVEEQLRQIGSYESGIDLAAVAEDPLSKWLNKLIARAKANLERQSPHPITNSELIKSIAPTAFDIADTNISIELQGNHYWKFVDKGVKGAKSSARAPDSPYSYKQKKPPPKALADWIANKTIQVVPRVNRKTGKMRTTIEQAQADARGLSDLIWRRGLRATKFMSQALDDAFVQQLTEQIAAEIGRTISFTGPPDK